MNEIIDSGIDVGVGLAISPRNKSTISDNMNENRVAKIISDGGYNNISYINEIKICIDKNNKQTVPSNLKIIQNNSKIHNLESENTDDYLITKL